MNGLLLIALCIFIGGPMIFFPEKILERPACKIKTKGMVRVCGVVIIAAAIIPKVISLIL